jgi:hypothetical protein
MEDWFRNLPPDVAEPRRLARDLPGATPIGGKAGDLVIWHRFLPHGSSPNTAQRPRMAQYILMRPAREDDEEERQRRITGWKERLTGLGKDAKEKEHFEGRTAELTPLGRKLLGLDRWTN